MYILALLWPCKTSNQTSTPPSLQSEGERAIILENGVKFNVEFNSQKTGFYLDQRQNRALIRSLSKDKHVLDLFTYTGGFAINAALGQAASVTAVDTSAQALVLGAQNAEANGVQDLV